MKATDRMVIITAILCITFLCAIAFAMHLNGTIFGIAASAISAMAGYSYHAHRTRSKK